MTVRKMGSFTSSHVSPYWYLLTAFVGLNLLQSTFTNWCPAMSIFRAVGLRPGRSADSLEASKRYRGNL